MSRNWKNAVLRARNRIVENWPIKITALVLAAIVWAAVAAQEPTTQLIAVDLEVEPPSGRTRTSQLPTVQVLYSGTARELLKLYAQPPVIRKVLPDTISGSSYTIDLEVSDLLVPDDAAVRAQRIEPRSFTIQLDDVVERTVPVAAQVVIRPDSGYELFGDIGVTPGTVTVYGARAELNGVDTVYTESRSFDRAREPISASVAIDTTLVGAVRLSHTTVEISADVASISERVLLGVPVVIRSDQAGPWSSYPPAVIVTVRGRATRIAELTRDSVGVQALFSGDPSDSIAVLQVTAPAEIRAWASPDTVVIRRGGNG